MTGWNGAAARNVGFNLLPWRQRQMRRLLRRRLIEWCAAALCGCACVVPLVGWQLWMRERTDARRELVEQATARLRLPFAEATRLASEAAAQSSAEQLARRHAKPLQHLTTLLDALVSAGVTGVALEQLAQHGDEVELQAAAVDETAVAEWLGGLRSLPEVDAVSVHELTRALPEGGARQRAPSAGRSHWVVREPVRVMARLVWHGMPSAAKPGAVNEARSPK
jgi:Tfp pilus assembly protein PilN